MFGFGKSKRIATGIKDIQMAIISQSYIFADSLAKEVDAVLSELKVPVYTKILTRDSNTVTCIDQVSFSIEAIAFYLNVLARACYSTPNRESAGTIILKPTVSELLDFFAKARHSLTGAIFLNLGTESMSFSGHETLNIRIYNLFLELILMINRAHCITLEELLQKKRNQT